MNQETSQPEAPAPAPNLNETPLINRSRVKAMALACAQQRARKFNRVSHEFYVACNAAVRNFITTRVANHPSVGKTLR